MGARSVEAVVPDISRRVRELADELAVASLRAEQCVARLAISVQRDKAPARDLLVRVRDSLVPEADADATEAAFLLAMEIDVVLADKRGIKRPTQQKWEESSARAERVRQRLGDDHPETRLFRERSLTSKAALPGLSLEAIDEARVLLSARGYPHHLDFQTSLRAITFAKMLRDTRNPQHMAEARQIVWKNIVWRAKQYGTTHPFTVVARVHHVVAELEDLEEARDVAALNKEQLKRADSVAEEARGLVAVRTEMLGGRHLSTVRTISYAARAERLRENAEATREWAQRAISQYVANPVTGQDFMAPAIMRVVLAEGELAAMRAAFMHSRAAREERQRLAQAGAIEVTRRDDLQRIEDLERKRGAQLRVRARALLTEARSVIEHQNSAKTWLARLENLEKEAQA